MKPSSNSVAAVASTVGASPSPAMPRSPTSSAAAARSANLPFLPAFAAPAPAPDRWLQARATAVALMQRHAAVVSFADLKRGTEMAVAELLALLDGLADPTVEAPPA